MVTRDLAIDIERVRSYRSAIAECAITRRPAERARRVDTAISYVNLSLGSEPRCSQRAWGCCARSMPCHAVPGDRHW